MASQVIDLLSYLETESSFALSVHGILLAKFVRWASEMDGEPRNKLTKLF